MQSHKHDIAQRPNVRIRIRYPRPGEFPWMTWGEIHVDQKEAEETVLWLRQIYPDVEVDDLNQEQIEERPRDRRQQSDRGHRPNC